MKEEVFEKFANKALQYLDGTEAFLKEQLPDYFQQICTYYAYESWSYVALGVAMAIVSLFCFCLWLKKQWDSSEAVCTFAFFIFFAGIAVSCANFSTALKATIAPKVFIVDYLRGKE